MISLNTRYLLVVLAVLMLSAVGVWAQEELESPTTPEDMLTLANHYYEVSSEQALPVYRAILEKFPTFERKCWAEWGIAMCYRRMDQFQQSLAQCEKIQKDYPGTLAAGWAAFLEGENYIHLNNNKKALDAFWNVIDNYSGLDDQGPVQKARQKMGEIYCQLVSVDQNSSRTKEMIARFSDEKANGAWTKATAAGMWARLGQTQGAMVALQELKAKYPDAKGEIAWACAEIGITLAGKAVGQGLSEAEAEDMVALLEAPRQLVPENAELVASAECALGDYYKGKRDYKAAIAVYEKALASYPNTSSNIKLHHNCGHALVGVHEYGKAESHFADVAYNHKDSGYSTAALFFVGKCRMYADKPAEAREAFNEVYEKRAEVDWKVMAEPQIAETYAKEKNFKKAAEIMNRAADHAALRSARGKVLMTESHRTLLLHESNKLRQKAQDYAKLAADEKGGAK